MNLNCNLTFETFLDSAGSTLLESLGFDSYSLPPMMKSCEVLFLNRIVRGVGIRNTQGGMEFFSRDVSLRHFYTVGPLGVVSLPQKADSKTEICCLFADMFDYLAYLTLLREKRCASFPRHCDCYVMNDVRNFIPMMLDVVNYGRIHCFFPNNDWGQVMTATFIMKNSRSGSESRRYLDYEYLYDYLMAKE